MMDELGYKDGEVITASEAATIEDIISKYNGVNNIVEESNTEWFNVKEVYKYEADTSSILNQYKR